MFSRFYEVTIQGIYCVRVNEGRLGVRKILFFITSIPMGFRYVLTDGLLELLKEASAVYTILPAFGFTLSTSCDNCCIV